MLRKRFSAYPLPTTVGPMTCRGRYSNERAKSELKVKLRPVEITMTSMAAAAVKLDLVERKYVLKKTPFTKVKTISPDMRGANLMLKVVSSETLEARERGSAMVDVVAGDETGIVTLRLTEEEAKAATPNKMISIRNGFSQMVKGYIRLRAGKWAKIAEEVTDEDIVPNMGNDLSAVEYELVTYR